MLSTSLTDDFGTISMGSDKLGLTHSTGLWQIQGDNGDVDITQLAAESNTYQTKLTVTAATGVTSSTTLFWPSTFTFPKNIDFNTERVEEASYYEVRADFDSYSGGPAVFLDETNGYIIAKAEHSSDVILTLYFLASSSPPATTPPSSTPSPSGTPIGNDDGEDDPSDEDREPISLNEIPDQVTTITSTTQQQDIRVVPSQVEWVTPILITSFIGVGLLSIIPIRRYMKKTTKPITKKIDLRFTSTKNDIQKKIKERWK